MIGKLEPRIQHYPWGVTDKLTQLRGHQPSGQPEAELWFGAHPSAPSKIAGVGLDALLAQQPDLLGADSLARFGPTLPYLLKVLAIAQPLSIQVHPDRPRAAAEFARETAAGLASSERNYRDAWPKPELLVAWEPTEVLCGFRQPGESAALLAELLPPEMAELTRILRAGDPSAALRTSVQWCLESVPAEWVVRLVEQASAAVTSEPGRSPLCQTAVELGAYAPADPGVVVGLLMNRVSLPPGTGVFVAPGTAHAYLHGFAVEIMASSDNVVRGGLTPKRVDVAEFLTICDFSPAAPQLVNPTALASGPPRYLTPTPEFSLWRAVSQARLPRSDSARIALALTPAELRVNDEILVLQAGAAAFLGAGSEAVMQNRGEVFLAAVGDLAAGPGAGAD